MFMKSSNKKHFMASHTVNDSTNSKDSERFFWYSIYIDATEKHQKKGDLKRKPIGSGIA